EVTAVGIQTSTVWCCPASCAFDAARMLSWRSLAVGLTAAMVCAAGVSAEPAPPRLSGTFLQLWSTHGTWTEEAWQRLFGYLERLRISEIVVQWTVYDNIAFYPSARHAPVPQPPLSL